MRPLGFSPNNAWQVGPEGADLVRRPAPARPARLAAQPKPITIDLARSAAIVVDMQNDFCHPEGWLASIGVDVTPARAPIAPIARLLPALRRAGVPIVWLNWGNRPDLANIPPGLLHVYDPEGRGTGLGAPLSERDDRVLTEGSWGAAVVDELAPEPGDLRVSKYRISGFWDTPLDSILRNLGVTTLLFTGVNADQCVLHTLADANFLGFDTILVEDCTATTSPAFCLEATLYNVRQIFGFTVLSAALREAL